MRRVPAPPLPGAGTLQGDAGEGQMREGATMVGNIGSAALAEARAYERHMESFIADDDRPAFHLTPRVGWMNDPNGFSYHDGRYHLFYQYNPYKATWAAMHWGHAVSDDLLTWEYLPVALAPDAPYDDLSGCFSGSALTLPDGRHLLMYTGVAAGGRKPDGDVRDHQCQCVAIGDGVEYVKYEGNPVISDGDLPEGASTEHFRDPKVWQDADGSYHCVVASMARDGNGQILHYRSGDCLNWEYVGVLAANDGSYGTMWECPDLFGLDGEDVLLVSPMYMLPEGHDFYSGNGTLCIIGSVDPQTGAFEGRTYRTIDHGIDFYATQTVLTPDGRRVMIAWMQNWDSISESTVHRWFGQMTVPRELHVRDGRLIQWPIRELDERRCNHVAYHDVALEGTTELEGVRGRVADLLVNVRAADPDDPYQEFVIWFAQDERFHCSLRYRPVNGTLKINRIHAGSRRAYVHHRKCDVPGAPTELSLRLVLDKRSVEVFINGGEQTMTMTIPTDLSADAITFFSKGGVVMDVEKYDLA